MIQQTQAEGSEITILCWDTPGTSDLRSCKIAAFMGVDARFAALTPAAGAGGREGLRKFAPRTRCLIAEAETLAKAADALPPGGILLLMSAAGGVFVYGFQPGERHAAILRELSSGSLTEIETVPDQDATFHVAEGYREWCGPFSGLSLGEPRPLRDHVFAGAGDAAEAIIRAGDKPFFVRIAAGESRIFLLGCAEIADLDETVRRANRPLEWFSRLVPLMMFLRGALADRVWHNDHPRACVIIDDPLLKPRYGFLEYRRLLETMRRQRFSACIAFIPWNYRRTSEDVASLVSSSYNLPFLCVHGCDHTRGEFLSSDFELLRGKAEVALKRMHAHRDRSGIAFDDVMVFPQCRFSAEAIQALKASEYLAGVNGAVCPSTMPNSLTLRDCLEVAVTRFADFPLFGRRYPRNLGEFAFDLFLGKPALVAEHHGYFKDGYEALEAFVKGLSALDQRLTWTNVATICLRACLTRTAPKGDIHVRFYTDRFRVVNDKPETRRHVLVRRQPAGAPLPAATVNGSQWTVERNDQGDLTMSVLLEAGQAADIRLVSGAQAYRGARTAGNLHNARVLVRRVLCEFRDNYVDTTPLLRGMVGAARTVRSRLKSSMAQA